MCTRKIYNVVGTMTLAQVLHTIEVGPMASNQKSLSEYNTLEIVTKNYVILLTLYNLTLFMLSEL